MDHPRVLLGLVIGVWIAVAGSAGAEGPSASSLPPRMDREKEIALALSACPGPLAANAGVYVLGDSGYVRVRESGNGFTAIVQRSLPVSQEPQCMDAEGARTILPRILKVAELRAQGKSREEIKRYVADAFARGTFQPPTRFGVDYMLSTENVVTVDEEKGIAKPFPPHVMFYAPYLTNADIGSDGSPSAPAFIPNEGSPNALVIVAVGPHGGPAHGAAPKSGAGPR